MPKQDNNDALREEVRTILYLISRGGLMPYSKIHKGGRGCEAMEDQALRLFHPPIEKFTAPLLVHCLCALRHLHCPRPLLPLPPSRPQIPNPLCIWDRCYDSPATWTRTADGRSGHTCPTPRGTRLRGTSPRVPHPRKPTGRFRIPPFGACACVV